MPTLDVIKNITIRGRAEGVDQAAAAMNQLAAAHNNVAVVSERTSRSTLSVQNALERQQRALDANYRAQQQLTATQRDLDRARDQGLVSLERHAQLIDLATERYKRQLKPVQDATAAQGLARYELINLGRQLQDVGVSLAGGQSPFTVLAQQGSQVADIFVSGQGTVRGFLNQVTSGLASVLPPARLVAGGIAGIGAALLTAAASWSSAQRETAQALTGIGRASGVTLADVNALAAGFSSLGTVSTAEARETATALAGTGKVGRDIIGQLIGLSRDFGKAFGVDNSEAAKLLARSFADPIKGAEDLNTRLGFMDAAMQRNIRNLVEQGRIYDAQRTLVDGIKGSIAGAAELTSGWARTWNVISNAASNVAGKAGELAARALGGGDVQSQVRALENARDTLTRSFGAGNDRVTEVNRQIEALRKTLAGAADESERVKRNLESLQLSGSVLSALPEIEASRAAGARASAAGRVAEDPYLQRSVGVSQAEASTAAARLRQVADGYRAYGTEAALAAAQTRLATEAITARSPAERASIAYRETMLQLTRSSMTQAEKEQQAQLAAAQASKEASFQLSEAARERELTARQEVAAALVEIDIIGKTTGEQYRLRAELQARQQLEQEAARNRTAVDEAHLARLDEQIRKTAALKQLEAERNLQDQIDFERAQLGRSDTEQQVQARLRSSGISPTSSQGEFLAQQLRVNEALRQTSQLGQDALKGFISDLRNGTSATQALGNALNRIADKLIDMATNQLWASAFGGSGGGGGLLASLFGSGSGGSSFLPSASFLDHGLGVIGAHGGAIVGREATFTRMVDPAAFVGATRYHDGGVAGIGRDEVPIIARKGEGIFTPQQMAAMGGSGGGPQVVINQAFDFRGADKNSEARIYAAIRASHDSAVQAAVQAVRAANQNSPGYLRK